MTSTNKTQVVKDFKEKSILISREFNAPLENVWRAYTESELLEQWWAPKPWKAETKAMNFSVGGYWLYAMVSPENEKHWGRMDYTAINPYKSFDLKDGFCDEEGNLNPDLPASEGTNAFTKTDNGTLVEFKMIYSSEKDLQAIVEMGFEQGITACYDQLENYLNEQFKLWSQLKTTTKARTSTYLNFPGTTEEAFLFYKSVFGSEFSGKGIQRFGDIPQKEGNPTIAEEIKKMVLHVELPILGGHILMATDAPKEMGMTVTQGNNMHICVEPESKAETKILFDALSKGGTIIMPLEDMFFGAYFGEFTDKFGINWMFNCIENNNINH